MTRTALILVALAACADPIVAEFQVVTPADDDPLSSATRLVLALEQTDTELRQESFEPTLTALSLPSLPFGEGFRLRLDAFSGPFLVARGRSSPFDVTGATIEDLAIYFAPIGRFSPRIGRFDGEVVACGPTRTGALVVSERGELQSYRHPGSEGAVFESIATHAELAGASWVALREGFVAATRASVQAVAVDGTLGPPLELSGIESLSVGEHLVALSGEPPQAHVVEIQGSVLRKVTEWPLPCEVVGRPLNVPLNVAGGPSDRVVTRCRTGELVALSPESGESAMAVIPNMAERAELALLGPGLVLAAGGVTELGEPSATLHVIAVEADGITELLPRPDRLFRPRQDHAMLRVRDGLVLIIGGRDEAGPVLPTELVAFPGDVVLTGSLPESAPSPCATVLSDDAVFVTTAGNPLLYVVPQ